MKKRKREKEKAKDDRKGPEELFFGDEKAQDLEWLSEEDFAQSSKKKKEWQERLVKRQGWLSERSKRRQNSMSTFWSEHSTMGHIVLDLTNLAHTTKSREQSDHPKRHV